MRHVQPRHAKLCDGGSYPSRSIAPLIGGYVQHGASPPHLEYEARLSIGKKYAARQYRAIDQPQDFKEALSAVSE